MSDPQSYQVIDKSYPRTVVVRCVLIFMAGLGGTAGIFWLLMRRRIGPTYGEGFRLLAALNRDILYNSLLIYGSTVLLTLICIALIATVYSHRVAGPVYRLRLFARRIGHGEVSGRVALRQSDVVHRLAEEMNGVVETFRQTVTGISRELQAMEKAAEAADPDLRAIKAGAGKITALIDRYRL